MTTQTSTADGGTIAQTRQRFRDQMSVSRKWAYFDHAAVAPIPDLALDRISAWSQQAASDGDAVWLQWQRQHEQTRTLAAGMFGADESEIALVPSTTFGINIVAEGYPWQPGDNVVLPEHEFPSNVYPWMGLADRGVELRQVPLDGHRVCPNRIADACDDRTRIVSASWVGYASGFRIDPGDLAQVAHDHGALFFLDAIQGLGVFPLDVRESDIDFFAADGHKWLLGPEGAGLFYLKRQHLDLLRPINVGWNSVAQGNDFSNVDLQLRQTAARYEGGTQNMVGFIGLGGSLQLLADLGVGPAKSPVAESVLDITDQLCSELSKQGIKVHSPRGAGISSGIVLFEVPGKNPQTVRSRLLDQQVVTSCRGGHLRAAAHGYNDAADVKRLIDALRQFG